MISLSHISPGIPRMVGRPKPLVASKLMWITFPQYEYLQTGVSSVSFNRIATTPSHRVKHDFFSFAFLLLFFFFSFFASFVFIFVFVCLFVFVPKDFLFLLLILLPRLLVV